MRPSGKIRGRRTLPGFILSWGKGRKALSGERAFLPPPNLLPPSPKTFDRWGGTPDTGTGIRHTPRAGFPPKSILRQHAFIPFKRIRYLSSKKRVEETKHVRKPFHTFPRYFSLPMHPTKQSHPADPPPYGKIQHATPAEPLAKVLGDGGGGVLGGGERSLSSERFFLPLPSLHLPYSTTTPNFASTDTGMAKRAVLRGSTIWEIRA